MNINNLKQGAFALAVSALLVGPALADGRRDFYFQTATKRYFDQAQNARTFGMAGSSVLTSSDSSSVVGNPAGLGLMKDGDLSVTYGFNRTSGNEHTSYRDIEDKEDLGSVAVAIPLGPYLDALPEYGNLGLAWTGYDSDFEDDSFNGQSDGYRVTGAYGFALSDTTSLGYSLTYFNDSLETSLFDYPSHESFRHTVGLTSDLGDGMRVGGVVFLGHGKRDAEIFGVSDTESDTFEFGTGAGVSQAFGDTTVAFTADYQYYDADGDVETAPAEAWVGGDEEGHVFNIRAGVEQRVWDGVFVRGGYRYAGLNDYEFDRPELDALNGSAKYNAWTAGLGVVVPVGGYIQSVNLDYGVEYRAVGDDDWQHVVTLSTPFTLCQK